MLPILRLIPVGGVTLAIVILVLALNAPVGSRPPLPRTMMPARGALIASADHPEWPRLLVNAALRRADELDQLRQIEDKSSKQRTNTEEKKSEKALTLAGVPETRNDAEPEGVTGTVVQSPTAVIPVDIGEASSTELPVSQEKERAPVVTTPRRSNPTRQSVNVAPEPAKPAKAAAVHSGIAPAKPAAKTARRTRRPKSAPPAADPAQFNFLAAFFESFNVEPPRRR
jgi:hypothetical protein